MPDVNKTSRGTQIQQTGFKVEESNRATKRGTRIVKKGHEMDKNAFLRILTAELTNQDPMNAKDSTAYVSQLAEFSGLEQMANLNNTMTFNSASGVIGKTVALDSYDDYGHQYGGVVKNVNKQGDNVKLTVTVPKYIGDKMVGYEDKEFDYKSLSNILDSQDENTMLLQYLKDNFSYLNNNMNFMSASSLINKRVELTTYEKNEGDDKVEQVNYKGTVKDVYKTPEGVKLKVLLDGVGIHEEKEFLFDEVSKIVS